MALRARGRIRAVKKTPITDQFELYQAALRGNARYLRNMAMALYSSESV